MLRLIIFLACFAAVVYAVFWLLERRSKPKGGSGGKLTPRGPIGPDDDDEFLRELERKRRHRKPGSGGPADPPGQQGPGSPTGTDGPGGPQQDSPASDPTDEPKNG